jgi:aspartate/methionine/tyrosine aminotransferase
LIAVQSGTKLQVLNSNAMQRRETLKTIAAGTISTGLLLDACGSKANPGTELQAGGPLAARGVTASTAILRVDMDLYFEATANLYNKVNNPNGAFPLNVAENRLTWPMLQARISKIARENVVEDWVAGYTSSVGAPSTRTVMASFLSRFLTNCEIDPEHICLAPGAAAVIDLTSWILCEPGDVAVIPAPAYPVYKQDIGNRPAVERYNLITHHELTELKNGTLLTVSHLDRALADIESKGKRFRMLIITNPDNPTGVVYTREQLIAYTDWCIAHNVHLVVNEIYGLSLLDTQHPDLAADYFGATQFKSFATIMQEKKSDYLHLWYALSKDFGVSGFRVGVVYSLNQTFRAAYNNLNAPSMMSNYAQWIIEKILSDHDFVAAYIKANQAALTENYALTVSRLRKLGIPYSPARGSLFVWMDLSQLLKDDTAEGERALWMSLYKESGVLLTPGDGFGHSKRGQFRLVYSYMMKDDLAVGIDRLARFVESKRA